MIKYDDTVYDNVTQDVTETAAQSFFLRGLHEAMSGHLVI